VYDGDIVIPTPAWVSYAPQARIIGREIQLVPTEAKNGWRITPSQIEEICRKAPDRPRIVVLNYPSNPTGGSYTLDELQSLAEVMRKYRAVVLSDEIYGKLHHTGNHASIVPLYPEGTIFSGGLSKWCGAGGWRLGIFVVPECMDWLLEAMAAVASETFTSTSAPIQYAAIRAFVGGPEIEQYLQDCRRVLRALGHHIAELVRRSGSRVVSPQGGFYLFCDFSPLKERLQTRGITTNRELCQRLLEEVGVAMLPGSDFGCTAQELTARLSYVDFSGEGALRAIQDIPKDQPLGADFLKNFCGPTLEAVELLVDWLDRENPICK
jgi:aspartate aminotransferase